MLDIRLYSCCLLITTVLSSTTQSNGNINTTQKLSIIYFNSSVSDETNGGDFPKKPQDVQIEYLENNQVKVKWKIDAESRKSLTGFGLQITCNYGLCKDTEYEDVILNDNEPDFDATLTMIPRSSDIILYSLPYKSYCHSAVRRTVVITTTTHLNWTFQDFIFIYRREKHDLVVSFRKAPVQKFDICLKDAMNSSQCRTAKTPSVTFKNIADGNCNIRVTPAKESCFCNDEDNCTSCQFIESSYNTNEVSCDTQLREYLYPLFGGLFIGILALLILFTTVKINGLRWHNLEKKSILLLNTNDNKIHEKSVENFITCLENLNITVYRPHLPLSKQKLQWLLNTVDNVLLIDSLALGKRQEAWAVNQDYGQFLQESNSRELTKHLFSVITVCYNAEKPNHFLRCKWNFVSKDSEFKNYPSDSRPFIIPGDFQLLAQMIHKSPVDLRDCKFSKSMLKQNILAEANFIKENPDWFTEKYGTSVHVETEVEIPGQPPPNRVLNASELISHVSSYFHKLNKKTDKELGINTISLSGVEVTSV